MVGFVLGRGWNGDIEDAGVAVTGDDAEESEIGGVGLGVLLLGQTAWFS